MANWYKFAYSYVEDLVSTILNILPLLDQHCDDRNCKKLQIDLQTQYRNLLRHFNEPNSSEMQGAVYNAARILRLTNKYLEGLALQEAGPLIQHVGEVASTGRGWWYQWESKGDVAERIQHIKSADPNQPGTVQLIGLNLGQPGPNQPKPIQELSGIMGEWMELTSDAGAAGTPDEYSVYIRGTKEAWDRFLSYSSQIFENHQAIAAKRMRLPFESQFSPGFEEPLRDQPQSERILQAYPLNDPKDTESLPTAEAGKNKPKRGIRLQFGQDDEMFMEIRDYAMQHAKVGMDQTKFRADYQNKNMDIFDATPQKWASLSKKLQDFGYDTKQLNVLIKNWTGKGIGTIAKEKAKTTKAKPLGLGAIQGALDSNLSKGIDGNVAANISTRFGVDHPMDEGEFNQFVAEQYPEVFQSEIPGVSPEDREQIKNAQSRGVYFATTRGVSVLADAPGSGKTAQSIVAADLVRNEGQKTLIITPNMLVGQNWEAKGGRTADGPTRFLGHQPDQVAVINDENDVAKAAQDPNVLWCVAPISIFSKKGSYKIVNALKQAAHAGMFSSLIFDEIQTIKNPDKETFKKLHELGSAYQKIPHRMGLTGTPSDNDPSDVYLQMLLLRHPLLYQNSGTKPDGTIDLVARQNQDGFTSQFLGGAAFAEPITLTTEERREYTTQEDRDKKFGDKALWKASTILSWARNLPDDMKLQILEFFSQTFIRRNKKDIRENIPEKTTTPQPLDLPEDAPLSARSKNWHMKELREMALLKAPHTAQKAIGYMSDPSRKVFVVSKHPEAVEMIVADIESSYGPGSAAGVTGKTPENKRLQISDTFKQDGGILPGREAPLRAVVYTMQLGAVGLNFAQASNAIFNDLDWNPSNNLQAEDRIHRINSQHPVNIDVMYFSGTYDEEMWKRVNRKSRSNESVSNILQSVSTVGDSQGRLALANQLIEFMVDAILLDIETQKDKHSSLPDEVVRRIEKEKEELFAGMEGRSVAANWRIRSTIKRAS